MALEILTWFGGKPGVVVASDTARALHLTDAAGVTFCGISSALRPVTRREANRDGCWCDTCREAAQS